jgi:hypothetical protein
MIVFDSKFHFKLQIYHPLSMYFPPTTLNTMLALDLERVENLDPQMLLNKMNEINAQCKL